MALRFAIGYLDQLAPRSDISCCEAYTSSGVVHLCNRKLMCHHQVIHLALKQHDQQYPNLNLRWNYGHAKNPLTSGCCSQRYLKHLGEPQSLRSSPSDRKAQSCNNIVSRKSSDSCNKRGSYPRLGLQYRCRSKPQQSHSTAIIGRVAECWYHSSFQEQLWWSEACSREILGPGTKLCYCSS